MSYTITKTGDYFTFDDGSQVMIFFHPWMWGDNSTSTIYFGSMVLDWTLCTSPSGATSGKDLVLMIRNLT